MFFSRAISFLKNLFREKGPGFNLYDERGELIRGFDDIRCAEAFVMAKNPFKEYELRGNGLTYVWIKSAKTFWLR